MLVLIITLIITWCVLITKIVVTEPYEIDSRGEFSNNVNLEFPFLVGLTTSDVAEDNLTVCTGTLISSVFVLSSAHCMSRFKTGIKVGSVRIVGFTDRKIGLKSSKYDQRS